MNEAEALFSRTFGAFLLKWSSVDNLRRVVKAGLPGAEMILAVENAEFAERLAGPEYAEIFMPYVTEDEKRSVMANAHRRALLDAQASVDGTSLVFAHSILDATAFDYCGVAALAAPKDWEPFVDVKTVKLAEVRETSYGGLLQSAINKQLVDMERQSLMAKLDRLFALCSPPPNWSPMTDFRYDREQIRVLDNLRHDIVHGTALTPAIDNVEDKLRYMQKTGVYLMGMLNWKYHLRIDANQAFIPSSS